MVNKFYMCHRNGFTLMELIVTIALIGILSAISVPAITQAKAKQDVRKNAADLKAAIYLAKSRAILEGRMVKFSINQGGRYSNGTDISWYPSSSITAPTPATYYFNPRGHVQGGAATTSPKVSLSIPLCAQLSGSFHAGTTVVVNSIGVVREVSGC